MSTAVTGIDVRQVNIATEPDRGIRINDDLVIPPWVCDFETFRRWAREERPEKLRVGYFAGTIWVDLSMEQAYSHNTVKTEVAAILHLLAKGDGKGRYFSDGMQLSLPAAEVVTVPDGLFVRHESIAAGRLRRVQGKTEGFTEFEGAPDMILEVVSPSSVQKDTATLPDAYFRAGVTEFWRVDARAAELRFEIFHPGSDGYVPTTDEDGWRRSDTFGRWFRMIAATDELGDPIFTLEHRE